MSDKTLAVDVLVEDHGSIVLFVPINDNAEDWLKEHTDGMWYLGGLVVEPRYVDALVGGIIEEGFVVR